MSSDHPDHPPIVKVVDRRWWAKEGAAADTAGTETGEGWQPEKPTYVQELERQVAEKDRQLQDTITRFREASREFDDARARLRKDVARDVERGRRAMLAEMLDVLDNLDRAIDASKGADAPAALVEGIDMVRRLFLGKLEGFGVRRIDALGQPFDPARHEAVTSVPTGDAAEDGRVCGVLTQGYTINDEVLRPAMVAVSQYSEPGAGAAS